MSDADLPGEQPAELPAPEAGAERARLAALRALRVLDTAPEPALDVITRLAADRFDVEIALVSLVDADRQWFKSRHGLDTCETPRVDSFCAHAIAGAAKAGDGRKGDGVMVVGDAAADARFSDNPLVRGAPFIRFYAGAPLVTADGHAIGTLCVIGTRPRAGVSERERAALTLMARQVMDFIETAAQRQEQRISQLIAETTTDAFVCSDPHSRIIHWNRAAETMFGWRADEVLGKPMHMIIPDRHRHGHDTGMARLRDRGPTKLVGKTVEVPAMCRAGHEIPVELSLGMWPAPEEGEPQGFAAIIRDVSARKALEAERAGTEARLAQQIAAIEASQDGIAITDAEGRFIFMNQAHSAMFGHASPETLIGRHWTLLYDERNARLITEVAMPLLASSRRWRGEVQGRRADGSIVEQEVSLSLSADGGIVCVTRDIGERLAMERDKVRLHEQLMQAQRQEAVGQLAHGIAHDFNNLLAAIAGTADLLERIDAPQVGTHARRIQSATATATGLLDKLMLLGRRQRDPKPVDLGTILSSVRDLVATSMLDTRHRIYLNLPAAPLLTNADQTELMQVVLNLALNARDALPMGDVAELSLSLLDGDGHEPVGPVMVGSLPMGPAALIRVSDTGCGIAPDDLARVFEPYYTRKGEAGTGLGLAVVAGIVAESGGAIALRSRPGGGTFFELWWPLQPAARRMVSLAGGAGGDEDGLAGKTVLVVDDNPDVVDTLVAMLEAAGAEPGPCLDPADALAAVREDPQAWSLVITDYDMPGMTGETLARALRDIRADLPLLLLSALPRPRDGRDNDVFDAKLAKPVTLDTLVAAATAAMAAARTRSG
ncbi:MAG: PAS domain S-box protein [Polymorphobacter sp.]|uniref:PAS domain S-box protein n=1 Tax=Polymorphobacter sp. TaxID=1909290 RepID=UPI003A866947